MLRVIKQKAMDQDEEMSTRKQRESPKSFNLQKVTEKLVSHVPVSVGSRTCASSANSSISSKADDEDGTQKCEVRTNTTSPVSAYASSKDSQKESLGKTNAAFSDALPPNLTTSVERPKKARKVSLELSERNNANTSESKSKKPRLGGGPIHQNSMPVAPFLPPFLLLARDQDELALSRLHVFVRNQIEVFTATPAELAQPAPGRKQPIQLHQVGLRCIHCRHLPNRKRVKRAVCYPSSLGRVYHSVSDMKFDHFSKCRELPADLRAVFETLKTEGRKSNEKKNKSAFSSTAQYYHDSALQMGMVNGSGGIFLAPPSSQLAAQFMRLQSSFTSRQGVIMESLIRTFPVHNLGPNPKQFLDGISGNLRPEILMTAIARPGDATEVVTPAPQATSRDQTAVPLAEEEDRDNLNPLHCFVRQQVEIFSADKNDMSAPAPGRKQRILLGQVGIRCKHCVKLPPKDRVKRAVCYPPSVGGIYHSVSNMKFDHFGICRGLPPHSRELFTKLKSSCGQHYSPRRSSSSTTAQYYEKSALRKGLTDTQTGIRFRTAKLTVEETPVASPATQKAILSPGMSALMVAASQASV